MKALPKFGLLLFCIFISYSSIFGAELVFTNKNIAIQSPGEKWSEVKLPQATETGLICAFRRKDQTASFFVMTSETNLPFDEVWIKRFEDRLAEKGSQKISGEFTTFAGDKAYRLVRKNPLKDKTATVLSFLIPKGKIVYQIEAMSMAGPVTDDKEIEAILKSFRFLK